MEGELRQECAAECERPKERVSLQLDDGMMGQLDDVGLPHNRRPRRAERLERRARWDERRWMGRRAREPHWVYYLVDGEEVVYVGHTHDVEKRLSWVRQQHPDWKWDRHMMTDVFPTKLPATSFERREIRTRQPRYNAMSTERGPHAGFSNAQYKKFGEGL